ncbi:hypothetical protein AGOR_G00142900 [Albula goreensis]|uniref:Uncharacterized protein n=1 Tax=Albula goreensis TaxID=1534307 RepID=A0A8T3D5P0_9TELE|nr:hypothetical protein AGOR_G00142900 [Albula goreensis]
MADMYPLESVYNLIPREGVEFETQPRYTSKFREQVKQEKQNKRSSHRTMGPAKMETPSPEKFLRKHSKEPQLPEKKPFAYMDGDGQRKPPIPARNEQPKMGICSAKNYIRDNAIKNALAVPKGHSPSMLTQNVETSSHWNVPASSQNTQRKRTTGRPPSTCSSAKRRRDGPRRSITNMLRSV